MVREISFAIFRWLSITALLIPLVPEVKKMVDYKVDGFQNERNFVQELDGKRVKQLQPLYYRMIIQLFGKVWRFKKVHEDHGR